MSAVPAAPEIQIELTAADGMRLAATRFVPAGEVRGLAVIASAMGVRRRFYGAFARHLAASGFEVLSFDYRGIGDSLQGRLREHPARLHEWGELDLEAALSSLRRSRPDLPLVLVTHSVGGQIAGMAPSLSAVDRVLTIASQSGHWRHWSGLPKLGMWGLWHVGVPVLTAVAGYLPLRLLGQGENVPRGVGLDWARGGRDRDYLWGRLARPSQTGFAAYRGCMRIASISDDGFAPAAAVDALALRYPDARRERVHWNPGDFGVRAIGHFGAFREAMRDTLWRECTDWLLAR